MSCQGKLSCRGPIAPRSGGLPRIRLDLTPDELLVLPPVERTIFHECRDAPTEGIAVLCYAYEEVFAEKVRALGDRARPRDLYDVINLYRNAEALPSPAVLLDVLERKCRHRGLAIPLEWDSKRWFHGLAVLDGRFQNFRPEGIKREGSRVKGLQRHRIVINKRRHHCPPAFVMLEGLEGPGVGINKPEMKDFLPRMDSSFVALIKLPGRWRKHLTDPVRCLREVRIIHVLGHGFAPPTCYVRNSDVLTKVGFGPNSMTQPPG